MMRRVINSPHDLLTPAGIADYLATTPFASTSVDALAGGCTDFVYRLRLHTPYQSMPTLVLKYAAPHSVLHPSISLPMDRQVRFNLHASGRCLR